MHHADTISMRREHGAAMHPSEARGAWCRGWESNPEGPEARAILRPREEGSEQRTRPIRCLFPCPRRVVESEDYGHPDGHLFLSRTSTRVRCRARSCCAPPPQRTRGFARLRSHPGFERLDQSLLRISFLRRPRAAWRGRQPPRRPGWSRSLAGAYCTDTSS